MKTSVFSLTLALIATMQASLLAQNPVKQLPHSLQKDLKNFKAITADSYHLYQYNKETHVIDSFPRNVGAFYVSAYEVTNSEWKKFHKAMVAKLGAEEARRYLPDTAVWQKSFPYGNYSNPMVQHYYNHPGYANYPLVGITWNQAVAYCNWKTEEANKLLAAEGKTTTLTYRLPTENEYMYLAKPRPYKELRKSKDYSWNSFSYIGLMDKHGYQANFGPVCDTFNYTFKNFVDDGGFYTLPVTSYKSNSFGLNNLKGNVEEWMSDTCGTPQTGGRYMEIMVTREGETNATLHKAKGGSWYDGPYYLSQEAYKSYPANTASPITGFRLAVDIVEVKPSAQNN